MKSWATIVWISKNKHWVVTRQDNGEGSVFENEQNDLEIGGTLFGDWTAWGGEEEIISKTSNRSFRIYVQGLFPSWKGALKSGKEYAREA